MGMSRFGGKISKEKMARFLSPFVDMEDSPFYGV
jgi:hypothetical protein